MFLSLGYALPFLQWLPCTVSSNSASDCPTGLEVRALSPIPRSASVSVVGCFLEDKIVLKYGRIAPRKQTHMGKDHLFAIAISGYRTSAENGEHIQKNTSTNDNSRTISFDDVTGIKTCLDLSPNQLVLRIACVTETTLRGHGSIDEMSSFCS
ncbi:hypothetical protein TNCV_3297281 [Trichonephila clavipes]|uniref:Uncharacterized protein n=1 Tax=Trichonephila clavipes TaxID=2585209 RepID=A0A8X6VPS5_TRICX|nr:hypothetical protein TNCV_3297281 [Trichonephila clavipes]